MSGAEPKRLSLPRKGGEDAEEREFDLDLFEVLLPCRNFGLSYRYAEVGSVSLVTEFLLRLVHAAERISEQDAAAFFGFDPREMRFALDGVEAEGYVSRSNGQISLTTSGRSLFQHDQSTPQIYALQSRQSVFGFDLLSLAPQDNPQLTDFERGFRELPIHDMGRVSRASDQIRDSFRRWFYELMRRSGERDGIKNASLYSIDEVSATKRFSACVKVLLRSTTNRPSSPEVDLTQWRSAQEVEDRGEIVEAVSSYVENLKVPTRKDDRDAYSILRDIASEFLSDFTRKDGTFSIERYLNETTKRAGELRVDRPTVPIVGTLFTPANAGRLRDALSYASKKTPAPTPPQRLTWLVPVVHWGQTRALPMMLSELTKTSMEGDAQSEDSTTLAQAMLSGKAPEHVAKAFDRIIPIRDESGIPPSLEILFVPGTLVAVLVHCPVQTPRGVPVPLGLVSFDELIIQRTHAFLAGHVAEDQLLGE